MRTSSPSTLAVTLIFMPQILEGAGVSRGLGPNITPSIPILNTASQKPPKGLTEGVRMLRHGLSPTSPTGTLISSHGDTLSTPTPPLCLPAAPFPGQPLCREYSFPFLPADFLLIFLGVAQMSPALLGPRVLSRLFVCNFPSAVRFYLLLLLISTLQLIIILVFMYHIRCRAVLLASIY